ncbi:LacI family transcriptional regulator [Shimazuella sp. AN120528]|uniref:LacI family DNA-binding transcriptional regulator n=1 Tax=Shimazuella soli TaxID=1892854 RepID=UPI001F0F5201|nr:LacI family DNA-binding transcriptional regulator [Shimazuella soli]MCH5584297.1 LacI family transcriptional regulator [Shimazuella soli]
MATIRDVAKLAGVSVATVSRVINKNGYVHETTKQSVEAAISQLNYRPNEIARTLYKKNSKLIGLIIPDITNPFFTELARAIEDTAHHYGYTVVLCNTDEILEKEKHYIEVLQQRQADGCIMIINEKVTHSNLQQDFPIVALDRPIHAEIPFIHADHYQGGQLAAQILLRKGSKHLVHIRGPKYLDSAEARYQGFLDIVKKESVSYHILESSFQPSNDERLINDLFDRFPETDGIFAANDVIAVSALKTALRRGIAVPEELQIMGYDGILFGQLFYPSISTIAQPIYQLGEKATKILLQWIETKTCDPLVSCLPVEWIERDTTRKELLDEQHSNNR